jgi:hypothetical protein
MRACSRSRGRKLPMPAKIRGGPWIDERIDLTHMYAEIWKDAAPAHLVDVAAFCDSDDTHTGDHGGARQKREHLCPALFTDRIIRLFSPSDL